MATDVEKTTQAEIKSEAAAVGLHMSRVLPFKKGGWLVRLGGGFQSTERIVAEGDEPGEFTRRWLERDLTGSVTQSPIRLVEDTVTVDTKRESQAAQVGQDPRVIAAYTFGLVGGPRGGLTFPDIDILGMPQSEVAERVHEIGAFVAEIGAAGQAAELRQAVARSPEPATAQ